MLYCIIIYQIMRKSGVLNYIQELCFQGRDFQQFTYTWSTTHPSSPSLPLPCSNFKMFNNWWNETWNLVYNFQIYERGFTACPQSPPVSPWNVWTDRNLHSYSVILWDKTKVTARSMPDKFRVKADNKLIDGTTQSGHWSKERHKEKGDATEITSILLFNTSHVKGSLTELFFFVFFHNSRAN